MDFKIQLSNLTRHNSYISYQVSISQQRKRKMVIKMKIGIPIILKADPNYNPDSSYSNIRDMALLCEQSGLDSIWLADHLLYREKDVKEQVQPSVAEAFGGEFLQAWGIRN